MSRNAQGLILSYRQKKWKYVRFGQIWGFLKNEFIKLSSSDPNASNSN